MGKLGPLFCGQGEPDPKMSGFGNRDLPRPGWRERKVRFDQLTEATPVIQDSQCAKPPVIQ